MSIMTMYYQNDPIYRFISHIGPPWLNQDSSLILNIAYTYAIIMAIIWVVLYILAKKGKIILLQFTIFILPVMFELTYWYIALPFSCLIIILFSLQNKYDLKLKKEEAKGITAITPEKREQQKIEWENSTDAEKQNKLNQYNYKSHKLLLLQTVNIPLLLILIVFSIAVTFAFHILSRNTYLFF